MKEKPWFRKFNDAPLQRAAANRGTYIRAALIICRWFLVSGKEPIQADARQLQKLVGSGPLGACPTRLRRRRRHHHASREEDSRAAGFRGGAGGLGGGARQPGNHRLRAGEAGERARCRRQYLLTPSLYERPDGRGRPAGTARSATPGSATGCAPTATRCCTAAPCGACGRHPGRAPIRIGRSSNVRPK